MDKKIANASENISCIPKAELGYFWSEGYKYEIRFNTSRATSVNVIDKLKDTWVIRLDRPHTNAEFHHININKLISGVHDPHIKLSPTAFKVGEKIAQGSKLIGSAQKILVPVSILLDCISLGISGMNDYENKTTRNTATAIGNISASWAGGIGGAVAGAAIGSLIFPGVGTIIGGIAGSLGGAIGTTYAVDYTINKIGDNCDYDTINAKCKKCDRSFKVRTYLGEKESDFCSDCN